MNKINFVQGTPSSEAVDTFVPSTSEETNGQIAPGLVPLKSNITKNNRQSLRFSYQLGLVLWMERTGNLNTWATIRKDKLLSRSSIEACISAEKFYERLCSNVQLQHSLTFQIYRLRRQIRRKPPVAVKRYIGIGYKDHGSKDVSNYSAVESANKSAIFFAEDVLNETQRFHLAEFIDESGFIDQSELPEWVASLLSVLPIPVE